jgi:hypothetical protein
VVVGESVSGGNGECVSGGNGECVSGGKISKWKTMSVINTGVGDQLAW